MKARPLVKKDYDVWKPIWLDNMQHQVSDEITASTWQKICDKKELVYGLGLFDDKQLLGILHYILHPTTGALNPVCYMQDLFVAEKHRRKGYARELLRELALRGKEERWERIYWIAANNNKQAQALYQNIGVKLDFSLHVLPLKVVV